MSQFSTTIVWLKKADYQIYAKDRNCPDPDIVQKRTEGLVWRPEYVDAYYGYAFVCEYWSMDSGLNHEIQELI